MLLGLEKGFASIANIRLSSNYKALELEGLSCSVTPCGTKLNMMTPSESSFHMAKGILYFKTYTLPLPSEIKGPHQP